MQRSVKQAVAHEDMGIKSMAVRVGFHSGPVISHAADVFGDTVNVAARVVAHAKPGQILVAKQTVRKLPREVAASMRFVGSTPVKGKKEPVELYELIWERENLTLVQDIAVVEAEARERPADRDVREPDDRGRQQPARPAHGARTRERVRHPRSARVPRARPHRVPPRPVPAHRSEPERHLRADAGGAGDRCCVGTRSPWMRRG